LHPVGFMHFARGYFGGGDNLAFAVNTAMNLILKLGFAFAPTRYRSIRIGCGDMLFIGRTGFGAIIVIVF